MARKSTGRWFRMYETILENPKVERLPGETYKGWVKLCALASRYGGDLPALPDIAFGLRMSEAQARKLIDMLKKSDLVDEEGMVLKMHNWDEHQYQSDVSTSRVKAFRERQNPVSETVNEPPMKRFNPVPETPSETETETETDQSSSLRSEARAPKKTSLPPDWLPKEPWLAFVEMRKKIRAPMTASAETLLFSKLGKLRADGHDPTEVLNEAVMNSWKSVYPLKSENTNGTGKNRSTPHRQNGKPSAADRAIRGFAAAAGVHLAGDDECNRGENDSDHDRGRLALVAPAPARDGS